MSMSLGSPQIAPDPRIKHPYGPFIYHKSAVNGDLVLLLLLVLLVLLLLFAPLLVLVKVIGKLLLLLLNGTFYF